MRPKDEIELDEDFDEDIEDVEDGEPSPLDAMIQKIITNEVAKSQAYIDEQLRPLRAKIDDHEHRLTNLEKQMHNLASASGVRAMNTVSDEPKTGLDKVLDATLGTVGRVLHTVVDTAAFICESAVDVVTLGRARVR